MGALEPGGLDRSHKRGAARSALACASSWYIMGDCKFGSADCFPGVSWGCIVRNFVDRSAENSAIHYFARPTGWPGGVFLAGAFPNIRQKADPIARKAARPNPAMARFRECAPSVISGRPGRAESPISKNRTRRARRFFSSTGREESL